MAVTARRHRNEKPPAGELISKTRFITTTRPRIGHKGRTGHLAIKLAITPPCGKAAVTACVPTLKARKFVASACQIVLSTQISKISAWRGPGSEHVRA